jgi:hypothetical protein
MSARTYDRIIKVSRTTADSERIGIAILEVDLGLFGRFCRVRSPKLIGSTPGHLPDMELFSIIHMIRSSLRCSQTPE